MNNIVSTSKLSKKYGDTYRVKDVDLFVKKGDIYGFLGPNGAGKSTTLKMLLGLVKPTNGTFKIFDQEFESNRSNILKEVGSLIESPSYYGHLSGIENMRVMQRLREVPDKNVAEALRIVRLENQKDKKVSHYSLGMKQRLGIAMALLAFPKLLILDEPTNGLDPAGISEIRELIQTLPRRYGITVLISSHLLSEIEQIATSVGIINNGKMLFQGEMDELKMKSKSTIAIKTDNNRLAKDILVRRGIVNTQEGDFLMLRDIIDRQVVQINKELTNHDIGVLRIEEHKKSLENIFLSLTGKEQSL
ncbi:ABC transporter ATP-binding protein [Clostridium intestinale]|uniref:ABC-2 type transport system ATP-binding protein n=1 Tax=Clostridium intestinale DSM 6191 TaxID=1121320 RepID=A0A1M5ZQC7_9CLOT|nr:ABC transporter ATP-binding protein [Clostridium intestinale]SHI26368.1 ABC-2 type transport system ATP-binding protein [Clostridium intestinale DSM 6191]